MSMLLRSGDFALGVVRSTAAVSLSPSDWKDCGSAAGKELVSTDRFNVLRPTTPLDESKL